MTEITNTALPRRAFLRGAACTLGAAALPLETPPTHAETAAPTLSLGYWDGARLASATQMRAGDASLCRTGVTLTVHGFAGDGRRTLSAIDTHTLITQDNAELWIPFYAWTAAPGGHAVTKCTLPVFAAHGLRLSAINEGIETPITLSVGAQPRLPKLRSGHYVLTSQAGSWAAYQFVEADLESQTGPLQRRSLSGFAPVPFDYAVLTIAPA